MRTIKETAKLTGVSIRTLRYYDEIGLLKPTQCTEAGYRMYDDKALEQLQQILFFKELEIPLSEIKKIMENPELDKRQILAVQKVLLEQKRNRLNGIIELITDVMEGVNTMNFEAFNDEDCKKIIDHSLELADENILQNIIEKFGSIEAYRTHLAENLKDEETSAHLIQLYGSKDKAVEASLRSTGDQQEITDYQKENDEIYRKFALAKQTDNITLALQAVERLAKNSKNMFHLDNAQYLLLEMAEDYLKHSPLEEVTDQQYGAGVTAYIGKAIKQYYGV